MSCDMPWRKSNSPSGSDSDRCWVHTRNRAEPGEYSQRRTALPRSEPKRKSRFTAYAYGANVYVPGSASDLYPENLALARNGCRYVSRLSAGVKVQLTRRS